MIKLDIEVHGKLHEYSKKYNFTFPYGGVTHFFKTSPHLQFEWFKYFNNHFVKNEFVSHSLISEKSSFEIYSLPIVDSPRIFQNEKSKIILEWLCAIQKNNFEDSIECMNRLQINKYLDQFWNELDLKVQILIMAISASRKSELLFLLVGNKYLPRKEDEVFLVSKLEQLAVQMETSIAVMSNRMNFDISSKYKFNGFKF